MLPRRRLISRCRGLPSVGVAEPILQKSQLKRQHQASERVSVEQLEAHAACNLSGISILVRYWFCRLVSRISGGLISMNAGIEDC
jgi:hypothetical protein